MRANKNIYGLFFLVILLACTVNRDRTSPNPSRFDTLERDAFESLRAEFAEPGKQYGTAPLWVWHTKVTKTIIDSMMHEFKENAFGGVMVHPRPGVITEYLSKDWLELYRYTVQKGKELGMNVWIYDENSYPTGFAGGHVPDQMPESYNQGQMLNMTRVELLPENTINVFMCLKEDGGKFIDITKRLPEFKGKPGSYCLFVKEYYGKQAGMVGPPDFPYVDLMVKGVTEKFIDITFNAYEKVIGKEFGKTVPGVFSDEPSIPAHGSGIRWTPDLFSSFKHTWGYVLEDHLVSLFEEKGDWKKIRHNYMQTISQLFIDRWAKPMLEYTTKKNLIWTGHYWEHGWPDPNDVPDNMAMYAWMHQPGIDMLFNNFNEKSPNAQFGNIRAVKELGSVANQLDKKRTLSETYGGGGWELTFKDMKRLGDWEYVLGVNFMNQHLSMMTLTGARKYDYPQSFSYHNSWWPYYKTLNQYFARLSLALSKGEQQNKMLIIEPTTSAWMYVSRSKRNPRFAEIGQSFQSFVTTLEKAQTEYDLGSENIIKDHGKIEDGKFVIGQRAYTTVVIPPGMENIDLPTFNLLKEYADKGGKVIQFEKIQTLDGSKRTELNYFNVQRDNIHQVGELNGNVVSKYLLSSDFLISGIGADPIGGNLYHQRKELNDGQLLFLSNADMNSSAKGQVKIKGEDALMMDLMTGEILDYPEEADEQGVSVNFELPAAGSMLLFISEIQDYGKQQGLKKYRIPGKKLVVKGSEMEVLRPLENTLMIDFCDVKLGDTLLKDTHVSQACKFVFQQYGFSKNPWDHQVQYKNRLVERDTFSTGTGFMTTYHFNIDRQVNYKNFRAVIEQRDLWKKILINGKTIKPVKDKWWLDRSFGVLEIGSYLLAGDNTLSVAVEPMSIYAEIEPIYILGDFNLESADKGWKVIAPKPLKPGSWKKQGLPMYGHSITYVRNFNLDNINSQFEVDLGQWKGTVAAVKVNGLPAGIVTSEPNTLDISKYLKKGPNKIEVGIVGSLKNLLGPHHNNPKPGMVGPHHWSNVKTHPAGKDYDTYDYGLMGDFKLVRCQISYE